MADEKQNYATLIRTEYVGHVNDCNCTQRLLIKPFDEMMHVRCGISLRAETIHVQD